jgi:hypothetical protein
MTRSGISGRELSRLYYADAVAPIIEARYPGLVLSAGLIGLGSEVLGFDDAMSRDHSWGPRLHLFLEKEDHVRLADGLWSALAYELPLDFCGYPTHFRPSALDPTSLVPVPAQGHPVHHRVEITTLPDFLEQTIGTNLDRVLRVRDWLLIPGQQLRSLAQGAVFHDGLDVLLPMQRQLAYYPHDVWLYLLSAQWQRIGQEEPFVGRAGIVGDEIGSAVIAARLVRDLMRLAMLIGKQYAPYPKWFGSAFSRLSCAQCLAPVLQRVLEATHWEQRVRALNDACEIMAGLHNELGITEPVPDRVSQFYSRPFMVIQEDKIGRMIWEAISDEAVKTLPFGVGKVDQYLDSTDVLSHTSRCAALSVLYEV